MNMKLSDTIRSDTENELYFEYKEVYIYSNYLLDIMYIY